MDPGNNAIIYAAAFQQGVWRSTNGGTTFTRIYAPWRPASTPTGASLQSRRCPTARRGCTLATARRERPLQDSSAKRRGRGDARLVHQPHDTAEQQLLHGAMLVRQLRLHAPGYPDVVYLGGSFSYNEFGAVSNGRGVLLSQNAGASFTDQTWDATSPDTPNGTHPDQHAIVTHPDNRCCSSKARTAA
jgi:hypothetical protein